MNSVQRMNMLVGKLTYSLPGTKDQEKGWRFQPGGGFLIYSARDAITLTLAEADLLRQCLNEAFEDEDEDEGEK